MEKISDTISLDKQSVIHSALKTVQNEKAGLDALEQALNDGLSEPFLTAVQNIAGINGRVVVTGLGKSGHIGAKIAATLASTGTPAFFVHAAEANHGDLGMIGRNDVILALSWSGETAELKGILNHSRRFKIPLIALTSGEDSALGRQADILLLLPKVEEACPHGLAPTTSTSMQLALGDALAVSLLEARHFSASDFKIYHPGGSLGASLSFVRDIMHKNDSLPLVKSGTPMPLAMQELAAKHFGCVAVIDDNGKLSGIVTEGDLARNCNRDLSQLKVDDVMTKSPKTVNPDAITASAMALLNEYKISALLVVENDKPIGILHFHDLLRIGTL
ncbi:KpsF/GutQ family sugar-phosphate isomerase [Bartonella sp. HY329]|uniref:KpsF/GutQ family sugar-phosphate isomerase n=1 Tax=unclassified Bartonella TaxID=2645622 RepID=UPI0021C9DA68|nr:MULTISPECIES: KpsF/GutQ family sugar-phosphate isomerase [unclassified Bartonella]UXM95353.1 KpsF/GutQ family sugar-phosphate isomerase [Bartonella sp. HY329]UXN09678.1 KpsF/GutQ family sugar-phosphate isomerase [Bartonella sp. HY328]